MEFPIAFGMTLLFIGLCITILDIALNGHAILNKVATLCMAVGAPLVLLTAAIKLWQGLLQ